MSLKFLSPIPRNFYCKLTNIISLTGIIAISTLGTPKYLQAQSNNSGGSITIRSDSQEANSETGVITAKGNVQINYPSRELQATAAVAQYFSREQRLVLNGNVYVIQSGNSMRAESMTYLVREGRFIATPKSNRQVESTYIVNDSE